jgi:fructose-bisphosphate aldolase class II
MLEALMTDRRRDLPDAVFAVHLDHGDEETCMDCIASGVYSSVMIDASHYPIEENIAITKRVVEAAHAKGIVVEAELGQLKGVEEDVSAAEHVYTKPEEAEYFVKKTGCDSLACAIGTSHGAFKFKGEQKLRFDILEEIQKPLPGFPLVMHGSSSVPQDEVERINAAGGAIKGASGVDASQFLRRGQAGRDQDQHRHRRPPGMVPRPPRVLPRPPGEVRPARSRQGLHGRVRQVHRQQERTAGLRRPARCMPFAACTKR